MKRLLHVALLASVIGCQAEPERLRHTSRCSDSVMLTLAGVDATQQGDPSLAEAKYREAIEACPAHSEAWYNLAHNLYEREDFEGAADAFTNALDLDPDKAQTWFDCAIAWKRAGNPERALVNMREAAERGHPVAATMVADLEEEVEAGRKKE